MNAVAFDTLKSAQALCDKANLSPTQAEGISQAFSEAIAGQLATRDDLANLATKDDLAALRSATKDEFAAFRGATKDDMTALRSDLAALRTDVNILEAKIEAKIDASNQKLSNGCLARSASRRSSSWAPSSPSPTSYTSGPRRSE